MITCRFCRSVKTSEDFYTINKIKESVCKKCSRDIKNNKYHLINNPDKKIIIDKFKDLVEYVSEKYGDMYSFIDTEYAGILNKIKMKCSLHGEFNKNPRDLKRGSGCPKCGDIKKGYNLKKLKNKESICYIIECSDANEKFIKIGITCKKIDQRFNSYSSMPYNYNIIYEISGSPDYIYNLEKSLHSNFISSSYTPLLNFSGSKRECFDTEILYKIETFFNTEGIIDINKQYK